MPLPNLIIAGAPKCGTSSLFQWIADHPDAEGSLVKETCYFADPESHVFDPATNFSTGGVAGYGRFFPAANPRAKVRLEATPTYIYARTALQHLPEISTRPRFVFLLREPSRQILSTYRYYSNNWTYLKAGVAFADFLEMAERRDPALASNELLQDAIANARYVESLAHWRDRVGPDRMRVVLLEDLQERRAEAMADLAAWLGLDPRFYADYGFPRENETYRVRSHALQAANVRLRGLLARTPLYKPVRALYRRMNTDKAPAPLDDRDRAALSELLQSFADANDRLAREFGLDLAPWREQAAA